MCCFRGSDHRTSTILTGGCLDDLLQPRTQAGGQFGFVGFHGGRKGGLAPNKVLSLHETCKELVQHEQTPYDDDDDDVMMMMMMILFPGLL